MSHKAGELSWHGPFFFFPNSKNKKHREDASSCSCDIIYGCHIRNWKLGGGEGGGGEEE